MSWNLVRLALLAALLSSCASSRAYRVTSPDPPAPMEPQSALGEWVSTFGDLTIEVDGSRGGIQTGAVRGSWSYVRDGQRVTGSISGTLSGTVLQMRWSEPTPVKPLSGQAFVTFDAIGQTFSGYWWSDQRDRMGALEGWRGSRPDPAML